MISNIAFRHTNGTKTSANGIGFVLRYNCSLFLSFALRNKPVTDK